MKDLTAKLLSKLLKDGKTKIPAEIVIDKMGKSVILSLNVNPCKSKKQERKTEISL